MEALEGGASLPSILMATSEMDPWHGVLWRTWRVPHLRCFFEATRARWSPTAGEARPPRVCAFVVATVRHLARGPDLVFLTLSGGAWCCSGILAMDPAWRWHSWCSAVCFSLGSSLTRVSAGGFGGGFESECWWTPCLDFDLAGVVE
jgi:hypothetical protein